MLRFTEIALGEHGGARCRRCHGAGVATLRDATDIIANLADAVGSWSSGPGPNVALTGTEPLRHPDLPLILRAAVEGGARRIRLDSDAVALGSPETARETLDAGVRHLQFGLLGSEAGRHDTLGGGTGAYDATLGGVDTFVRLARELDMRVQVSCRVRVCRHNMQDLPATVMMAAKAGAAFVRLTLDDPTLSPWSAGPWIESACDTGILHATWVEVEGLPFEAAEGWELHLASLYNPVAGDKAPVCATCALDAICGGVMSGAAGQVTGVLRPPANAQRTAARIESSFNPPLGRQHG